MKNNLFNAYHDFCHAEGYYDLTLKITHWIETIFGYDKLKIMFCENDKLVSYAKNKFNYLPKIIFKEKLKKLNHGNFPIHLA